MNLRTTTPVSIPLVAKMALIVISVIVAVVVPLQMSQKVSADQFDDRINALQQDIARYQAEGARLNIETNTLKSTLSQISNQKAAIQAQVDISQAKHDQLVAKIAETEKKIKTNQDALGTTIAKMYVDDKISPIEMLASSKTIGQYLDMQEYRSSVRSELTATIGEIKNLKKELETQRTEIAKVLEEQKVQRDQLVSKESEQQTLLNRTQGDEMAYQRLISSSIGKINEERALQAALRNRGNSTGGYTMFDSGLSSDYITDANFGSWNDSNCPMGGYINNTWVEYASTLGSDGNGGDGHGFGCRQCASYVAWRVGKETGYYPSGSWGDAYSFTWKSKGSPWNGTETSSPHRGSIAVLGNSAPGHVAWVETDPYISTTGQLAGQSVILVSQYNWDYGTGYGMYSSMELSVNFFDHYIQIVK